MSVPNIPCNPTTFSFSLHPGVWSIYATFCQQTLGFGGCLDDCKGAQLTVVMSGSYTGIKPCFPSPSTHLQLGESHNDPVRFHVQSGCKQSLRRKSILVQKINTGNYCRWTIDGTSHRFVERNLIG